MYTKEQIHASVEFVRGMLKKNEEKGLWNPSRECEILIVMLKDYEQLISAESPSKGMKGWVKVYNGFPKMEKVVYLKDSNGVMNLGNFYEEDGCYMCHFQKNGAHEEYETVVHKFTDIFWLDESDPSNPVVDEQAKRIDWEGQAKELAESNKDERAKCMNLEHELNHYQVVENNLKQRIEELEKENAELKENIRQLNAGMIHFSTLDKMPTLGLLDRQGVIDHVVNIGKKKVIKPKYVKL